MNKYLKYLVLTLIVFVGIFGIYHIYYAQKIIPGVYVGNVSLGGLNFKAAVEKLTNHQNSLDKTITLKTANDSFVYTQDDIGLEYNAEASVVRAFEVGRTGNIFIDSKDKIAGLVKPLYLRPFYDVDSDAFSNMFSQVDGELSLIADDASFYLDDSNTLQIKDSADGRSVDIDTLHSTVLSQIESYEFSEVVIPVTDIPAEISEESLDSLKPRIEDLVFIPITLTYDDQSIEVDPPTLLNFIKVSIKDDLPTISLNSAQFDTYAKSLELNINKLPRGKVVKEQDGQVLEFEITEDGREIDQTKFKSDFRDILFAENLSPKEVPIATTVISSSNDSSRYGIYSLLGTGSSKFNGSAQSRITNLTLAAKRTDGVLVAPGATYSFNDSVGEISSSTGYATAYVIANGRTVLGDGGGVCQTSTTLFRAALDAGLPIVTRHPHAYRVNYYEIESPVGIDASIYQPYLDFEFKNDTPNHILIQTSWDLSQSALTFKIYGTPDGRSVEMTEPEITAQLPPPEPLYQDDPTLAKGVVKQVDFAAWGATVTFDREVKRNDEVIHNDTFKTAYQPWRAVYLVGTKE